MSIIKDHTLKDERVHFFFFDSEKKERNETEVKWHKLKVVSTHYVIRTSCLLPLLSHSFSSFFHSSSSLFLSLFFPSFLPPCYFSHFLLNQVLHTVRDNGQEKMSELMRRSTAFWMRGPLQVKTSLITHFHSMSPLWKPYLFSLFLSTKVTSSSFQHESFFLSLHPFFSYTFSSSHFFLIHFPFVSLSPLHHSQPPPPSLKAIFHHLLLYFFCTFFPSSLSLFLVFLSFSHLSLSLSSKFESEYHSGWSMILLLIFPLSLSLSFFPKPTN